MLSLSLCDYSDVYILASGTIAVAELAAGGGNNNIQKVFKNFTPFTDCISEINNTQIDTAKYIDVVMPMYDLIEYSENYQEVHGNNTEMDQLWMMLVLLLIFLVTVLRLNLQKNNWFIRKLWSKSC